MSNYIRTFTFRGRTTLSYSTAPLASCSGIALSTTINDGLHAGFNSHSAIYIIADRLSVNFLPMLRSFQQIAYGASTITYSTRYPAGMGGYTISFNHSAMLSDTYTYYDYKIFTPIYSPTANIMDIYVNVDPFDCLVKNTAGETPNDLTVTLDIILGVDRNR